MFEGKGRAVGYVNNSMAIVHWMIVKGTVPEPADVPGEKLVPIIIGSICSRYPDCGKASNPLP